MLAAAGVTWLAVDRLVPPGGTPSPTANFEWPTRWPAAISPQGPPATNFCRNGHCVIDGDTIRHNGRTVRLVGFDTPESGRNARCGHERQLADRASARLRQLVGNAREVRLDYVRCACRPGTHDTPACNYGRACGSLRVDGRDVGPILVREGLARPYHCGPTGCPRRQTWC